MADELTGQSAVHVFVRVGTVWTPQAHIKASTVDSQDRFGAAVALSGDTLAVGAPGEDSSSTGIDGDQANNSAANSGAAYVFQRSIGFWGQLAYLKASNTDANDEFGSSIAVSGDTVVVGSPWEASSAKGINGNQTANDNVLAGAVYVFRRGFPPGTPGSWTQEAYIKASNTNVGAGFGSSVALSGETLAVGSYLETSTARGINGSQLPSGVPSGAVYVFARAPAAWAQQAYIKASNTGGTDQFGVSVALSGDLLGVGAVGEASSGTDQADDRAPGAGAAYLFVRNGDTWSQSAYAKASNVDAGDLFGASVAVSTEMVVGAPGESSGATGINPAQGRADNSASGAGAIYVFR